MQFRATIQRRFQVAASPEDAFSLLADVPDSVSHFPRVASLTSRGGGVYAWRLEPLGPPRLVLSYACRYTSDRGMWIVRWTPVAGEGNARVGGRWRVAAAEGGGAELSLETALVIEAPTPRFLRRIAEATIAREQRILIDGYAANLTKTLGGGDGRLRRG